MKRKPWHRMQDSSSEGWTADLPGMESFIKAIIRANELRREKWLQEYPDDEAEIIAECNDRDKLLNYALEVVQSQLTGTEDERYGSWVLLMTGMVMQRMASIWYEHMVELGVEREGQVIDLKSSRTVEDHYWCARRTEAEITLDEARETYPNCKAKVLYEHAAQMLTDYINSNPSVRDHLKYNGSKLSSRSFQQWLNWKKVKS